MSGENVVIHTLDTPPSCTITITSDSVIFDGSYYNYVLGEFQFIKQGRETISKSDFMGMGYLKKRSNKRMIQFLVLTGVFSFLSSVSDNLKYLPFLDTGWLSVIINIALLCSIVGLVIYLFSKKSMVEISFMGRRICLDKKLLSEKDFSVLSKALKSK